MEFVLIWIICGIIAGMIGAQKGMGCSGFIAGVLLGPLGIILVLVLPGTRVKCQFCQKLIDKKAIKCPYCQSIIDYVNSDELSKIHNGYIFENGKWNRINSVECEVEVSEDSLIKKDEDTKVSKDEEIDNDSIDEPTHSSFYELIYFISKHRMAFIALIITLTVVIIVTVTRNNPIERSLTTTTQSKNIAQTQTEVNTNITYEVIRSWSIPGGGEGKVIIISPSLFNQKDMRVLGQQLREENTSKRYAIVEVYDNKDAPKLESRYISEQTTPEETAFYEKHRIALYEKDGSGANNFYIFFDGFMADNFTTIKY